jgi:hypothetical protein
MEDGFSQYRTNLRKEYSSIRSQFNGGGGRDGVKGQDERQSTAPLTPPRPPEEDFARELKKRA